MNNKHKKNILTIILLFAFIGLSSPLFADMDPAERQKSNNDNALQRQIEGFYDLQRNKISNIEFSVTNTGMSFFDQRTRQGTGIWPRGSINCYVFGGGIWVGSQKRFYIMDTLPDGTLEYRWKVKDVWKYSKWDREHPIMSGIDTLGFNSIEVVDTLWERMVDTTIPNKLVGVTYDPQYATSAMAPGRIEDGDAAIPSQGAKYRIWFSLDYSPSDGSPLLEESGPAWPIWDNSSDSMDVLKYDRYFGHFILNENLRNTATYPRGPAFISGEDIFCTYKDTDLTRYSAYGGVGTLARKGYPQRIQYEQMIYSWGFGDYRDFVFIKYDQINRNLDTLWDMWLAPIFDVDITLSLNYSSGAQNDVTCFYGKEGSPGHDIPPDSAKATKNMAYQYSQGNMGEAGRGFGYCGFVFLESPSVIKEYADTNKYTGQILYRPTDSMGFTRRDTRIIWDTLNNREKEVRWYPVSDQLGLVTFRNWAIKDDKKRDEEMYPFFSSGWKDGPAEPGDMRYMMATGPFNLRPNDTARTVVGLVIAATGKGGDADGTPDDLTELVRKVDFMQKVYDENFRAPQPPSRAVMAEYTPLNNGMIIRWDSTSEMSSDPYEKGLNFMGYKIYRARRMNLDTFATSNINGNSLYPSGQGPFGWKELRDYSIPTPFVKSNNTTFGMTERIDGSGPRAQHFMGTDSLMVVGPDYNPDGTINLNNIICMRVPRGIYVYSPNLLNMALQYEEQYPGSGRLSRLERSGWYSDTKYGKKVSAVLFGVDSANYPWGEFYYNNSIAKGMDLYNQAYYYKGSNTGNFLLDSVMLVTLELNPSLAKLNPLFYERHRVRVSNELLAQFYTVDTAGKALKDPAVWITKDSVGADGNHTTFYIKIDTLYELGTEQLTTVGGSTYYTMSVMTLRPDGTWLENLEHYNLVMDSIYMYINKGWVKEFHMADFTPNEMNKTDFPGSEIVKREVIIPYMDIVTNHRTFIDVGDDPEPGYPSGNGNIATSENIAKSEVLFNNVEYYYKVIAYDEGDFTQPTPLKLNEGLNGLPNLQKTYPSADRGSGALNFSVIGTEGVLGGLYNFKLYAIDEQRASQLFAGDTLELLLEPYSSYSETELGSRDASGVGTAHRVRVGMYGVATTLKSVTTGETLYGMSTDLEVTPGQYDIPTTFVDYSGFRAGTDTLLVEPDGTINTLGKIWSKMDYPVSVRHFWTGDFQSPRFTYTLNGTQNKMWGNIGFSFDAAIKQFGGMYRGDDVDMLGTNVTTKVKPLYFAGVNWDDAELVWLGDSNSNRRPNNANYSGPVNTNRPFEENSAFYNISLGGVTGETSRFDNGPGIYTVEFLPGGTEEMDLYWAATPSLNEPRRYRVSYLNVKITDEFSYNRPVFDGSRDSLEVRYPSDIPFMKLPIQSNPISVYKQGFEFKRMTTPNPWVLSLYDTMPSTFYRHFNLYAQAYANARSIAGIPQVRDRFVKDDKLMVANGGNDVQYIGTQGRYYLTAISEDGRDTLDFVHTMNIAGAQFAMSYFERGRRGDGYSSFTDQFMEDRRWTNQQAPDMYGQDFKAGDKIKLSSWGGTSGFPEKGARVLFAVSNPYTEPTDNEMDQIKVVPNPYVITHQQQKSAYDAQLYFTRLPKECTINIFTAAGDLVQTIEHNENVTGTRHNVDIWDLITKNGQRMQSQTLVAVIKTPNGAETIKQFSVIVGGFRVAD
ncbi:MAG: hypothetical protein LBO69_00855 [Ignavibacteria bacterium]|jgi:hypothetical protein|nr:hypothetical protein [Ignavibacteria bacterium]